MDNRLKRKFAKILFEVERVLHLGGHGWNGEVGVVFKESEPAINTDRRGEGGNQNTRLSSNILCNKGASKSRDDQRLSHYLVSRTTVLKRQMRLRRESRRIALQMCDPIGGLKN